MPCLARWLVWVGGLFGLVACSASFGLVACLAWWFAVLCLAWWIACLVWLGGFAWLGGLRALFGSVACVPCLGFGRRRSAGSSQTESQRVSFKVEGYGIGAFPSASISIMLPTVSYFAHDNVNKQDYF